MTDLGPNDPALRQQWRAARRAVARGHHPDRGGDATVLIRALAEVDDRYRVAVQGAGGSRTSLRSTRRWARRRKRRACAQLRLARSKLPVRWPGSKRYFDL